MNKTFSQQCQDLRRPHAAVCFTRAILLNKLAHGPGTSGRSKCFQLKTRFVEESIRLAPEAVFLDDFQLRGGTVGVTYPTLGRLHVRLGDLNADTQQWVFHQIRMHCQRKVS